MKSRSPLSMNRRQKAITHVVLAGLCIPFLMPILWMVSTSLKADTEIFPDENEAAITFNLSNMLPEQPQWQNYRAALDTGPFVLYLRNSLLLGTLNVIGAVFSSALVAYGFARLQFPGKNALFILVVATMALPRHVTMIPVFTIFKTLGWYGTLLPLIVPAFFGNPFFIFLLHQFFQTIPRNLTEAATIDGASELRIFSTIMLPLAKPALATCALFQFLATWNDFFGPLLYINNPDHYTVAYGLQQFMGSHDTEWSQLMAVATLFTLPIVILFFRAQKVFIQGISTTGAKG
ncbi:L-arabinose transport system permease protein AraQ [Pontiella desulfatans]|uniref:sn-glycerol-3-phosphate transport system permease protein UgpE n=1 Tax=Pontiella desulfatans TaxID=2750659 RepID=A0A6C2U496_PONDE|nr:carbohydrate ABC transporter permease [Pontiella desulfatans]VGO14647.1 L-arabinose transport system permease protein AraQ [Pontiella desulfatans]